MKKIITLLTIIAGIIIIIACSEYERSNPFDPESDIVVKPLTNLSFQIEAIDKIKLIWDSDYYNDDGYTFNIDKKTDVDTLWQENYKVFNQNTNFCIDSTGIQQTNYYRIRVSYDENISEPIEVLVSNPFPAPTNLVIEQNNVYTFTLNWTDNSIGEDGFKIERKIDDGIFTEIATTTDTTYVDDTVTKKGFGNVYYQVKAYKETYFSSYATQNSTVSFPVPTNLTATQTTITSANISWSDNSIGEEKFEIERKLSTETTYVKVAEVTGSDTADKSWDDITLIPNSTYDYRIKAVKGSNTSSYVSYIFVNTFLAPSGLTVNQNNVYTFTLNWTDNSNGEDGFKIERKIDDGIYTEIASIIGTTYVDDTVTKKGYSTVYYQVKAYKGTFSSFYVTQNSAVNFPAPTNLIATQTTITSANITLSDNSIGEDKFEIERKLSTETTYVKVAEVTGSDTADKSWDDADLVPNLTYDYRVKAVKGSNDTDYNTYIFVNTFIAPSSLTVNQDNVYTFTLNWTDNSNGEDGFKIERKIDDGIYTEIASIIGTTYVDDTVTKKGYSTVYYQVKAYKGTFSSFYVTQNSAVNFPAPTNLIVTQTTITSAKISWSDNSIGEDKFEIERKLSTETTYVKVAEVTGSDTANKSWDDADLVPNLSYDYRVKAVTGNNTSSYITSSYVNTFPAPTEFKILTPNITTANLIWEDNSIGEDGFKIDRKVGEAGTWEIDFAEVGSNVETWIDMDFSFDNSIYYRIKAYTQNHVSNYLNLDMTVLFSKSYSNCRYNSIKSTTDGGYILLGSSNSNILLTKTDAIGNIFWSKTYGGFENDYGVDIQLVSDEGYIILGTTMSFGSDNSDLWLIRTDIHGNELWNKTFDGIEADTGVAIQQTTDGGYILLGNSYTPQYDCYLYLVKTDDSGIVLWDKTIGYDNEYNTGSSLQKTQDGGFIISTFIYSYYEDYKVAVKIDEDGNEELSIVLDEFGDAISFVSESSDGSYIMTGYDIGDYLLLLTKVDASSNVIWRKTYDSGFGYIVKETLDGDYIVLGDIFNGVNYSALFMKTDTNGNILWNKTIDNCSLKTFQKTIDGGYVILGTSNTSALLLKTDINGNTADFK